MRTHSTTRKHWIIDARDRGGQGCKVCGAEPTHRCSRGINKGLFEWNEVHAERVRGAGHNVVIDELPIHRSKAPHGAFAELRKAR